MQSLTERWLSNESNTEQSLTEAATIYYSVVKLLFAKSFDSITNKPITSQVFPSDRFDVILKRGRAFSCKRNKYLMNCKERELTTFTELLERLGLPKSIKQAKLCISLCFSDYIKAKDFHFALCASLADQRCTLSFDLRNETFNLMNFLVLRNTLEVGFEYSEFNRIALELFNSKGDDFFATGYPFDFFVHDRVSATSEKPSFWVTYKDRISTFTFSKRDEKSALQDPEHMLIYQLA